MFPLAPAVANQDRVFDFGTAKGIESQSASSGPTDIEVKTLSFSVETGDRDCHTIESGWTSRALFLALCF